MRRDKPSRTAYKVAMNILTLGEKPGMMLWLQKLGGEPWLWSILPEDLGSFLEETGWKMNGNYQRATRKFGVEYFVMAEKITNA